ncbi:MAG: flagellar hook-associated protein FlgK [Burkholderiales bacterium]|nr:flagellar hook-associated protein FlgK [Burkholderiales bacterium]
MGNSIFGIGTSGMNAAMAGLVTTGHNISNASTPGFTRQETVQVSNLPQFTGVGFFGQGVGVSTVKRIYSDALSNQLTVAQAQGSQLDAYYAQIKQLDTLLGDPSAGLAPALQGFFSGVADVAAHPESVPSRQSLLSSANALSARFQDIDQQISEIRSGINSQITSSIDSINQYAQQIAKLNQSILAVESATAQQPANDLRDQRDALVSALNLEVRASVVKEGNGAYDVFVGNGQPVVVGSTTFALSAARSLEDAQRVEVGYQNGASIALIASENVQGGRLGGLLSFRTASLDAVQNSLGRVAMGVAQTFNDQHLLGQDLNGNLGKAFFTIADPKVLASSGNVGGVSVTATVQDVGALTTSDYRLQYNGTVGVDEKFTLTRISDGFAFPAITFPTATASPPGFDYNVDGITLNLSPGSTLNDSWLIEPTRFGAGSLKVALSDPAAIAAAAPIRTDAPISNKGDAAISAGSVSSVSNLPAIGATVTLTYDATAPATFAVAVTPAGPTSDYPATIPAGGSAVMGGAPIVGAIAANALAINGTNIGVVAAGANAIAQGANLAAAITAAVGPAVTATSSPTTGAVTLTAADGREIAITGDLTGTGLTAAVTPKNTINFNGISFSISGTPADGDTFTLKRNTNGVSDNRNALALGALQTANTLGQSTGSGSQPTTSFQGAYSQLVSQVGNTTRQMEVTSKAQANMIAETKQAQQSVSGVNLDEEAANLLRYQQAYQAAGKAMQIASTLFQTVLDLGR